MPHVVGDGGRAADRIVLTGRGRVVDRLRSRPRSRCRSVLMPRTQLASTFEPSASAAPWVRSGTRFAIPPVPVVLRDAGPGPLEPGLDRELGEVELGRIAERDVRPGTAEVEGPGACGRNRGWTATSDRHQQHRLRSDEQPHGRAPSAERRTRHRVSLPGVLRPDVSALPGTTASDRHVDVAGHRRGIDGVPGS